GVAGLVVEAGHLGDPGQAAGERDQEEQREHDRRDQDRRADHGVVDRAPGHGPGHRGEAPHVRPSRVFIALLANARETTTSRLAKPNASASALASHPMMIRLRMPSIMYETGL